MQQYNFLILTDHSHHSGENSVYALARTMCQHPLVNRLDIATRGFAENHMFFKTADAESLWATTVHPQFDYDTDAMAYKRGLRKVNPADYDMIWLRLPPPIDKGFLDFLAVSFPNSLIINHPKGIYETGSKAFLVNFQAVCPPMQICTSIEDIIQFKQQFPIVLKPFREYGGKGIVRIDGDKVWQGNNITTFQDFIASLDGTEIEYLGVKFLHQVGQGDKRIVVVNGQVVGASLRLPAKDSWLCNVAQGGSSQFAAADEDELVIIAHINPILTQLGIAMYGVDTLMGDKGKRVLSEINTTSIGGIPQMEQHTELPKVAETVTLIIQYFLNHYNA